MEQLNVLVYGTGSVGIFFGGKLFKAGFNVTFVDVSEKVEELEEMTLRIQSQLDQNYEFTPPIVSDVSDLPGQDLILVCVKAFQTYEIAFKLLPVVKPSTITLSLQNGLENEKILSDLLGKNLVMGAVVHFSGQMIDACTVVQHAPAQVVFGEQDHQASAREEWLSNVFAHADINHSISRNITQKIWEKLIWNNAFNTISSITQSTIRQIYDSEAILSTIRQMMQEVQQVAQAEGVEISDQALDELLSFNLDFAEVRTSMLKDIEAGSMPEIEPLVGILLQKAKKYSISVPVNQTIYNLLQLSLNNAEISMKES